MCPRNFRISENHYNRVERAVEGYLNNFELESLENCLDLESDIALFKAPQVELQRRQSSERFLRVGDASATWKMLISAVGQSLPEAEETVQRRFNDAVTTLRLLKPGGVEIRTFFYRACTSTRDESDITNDYSTITPMPVCREGTYKLEVNDLPEVKRVLQALAEATDGRIRRALHRFNVAYLDYRDDDKLIDNVIALEALMLPESSQELGLKLAIRSACLLADTADRKAVFEFVRLAYKYRSGLVHGGESDLPNSIKCGLKEYQRHEFVIALQGLVRKAVQLYLDKPDLYSARNLEKLNPFV